MSNYTGVSPTIFDEPEYRDQAELNIAIYLIVKSDMIGVCPIIIGHVAKACRTSAAKVRRVLLYFEQLRKLKIGGDNTQHRAGNRLPFGTHICWYSKAYHSLRKGKCSSNQLLRANQLLSKWQLAGIFGQNFADEYLQLYAIKYKIKLSFRISEAPSTPAEYEDDTKDEDDTENESKVTTADKPPAVGKGKKEKKETDPDHDNFKKFWHEKYEHEYNRKYDMEGGKGGVLIGKILHFARNGRPSDNEEWKTELAGMVELFFRTKNVGPAGHTLGTFYYRRHELREAWNE